MVCEIEDSMPIQELARWIAYIEIENPFQVFSNKVKRRK